MWVAESARGLGIGRRLLAELEARAAKRGSRVVRMETNRALTEAIALYLSAGYAEVPAFNHEPFAHHWFEKRLNLSPKRKHLQIPRSRRPDSNREPLHYEGKASEGLASSRGHARALFCRRPVGFHGFDSGRARPPVPELTYPFCTRAECRVAQRGANPTPVPNRTWTVYVVVGLCADLEQAVAALESVLRATRRLRPARACARAENRRGRRTGRSQSPRARSRRSSRAR